MAGAPILSNVISGYRVRVEAAWGADLSAPDFGWTWTEITTDVMMDNGGGINITIGRGNGAQVAQPASCTFRLKNQGGAYTPTSPTSSNYPNVRLGTPIRVRISVDGGSVWHIRFQGEASSWAPGWDAQGKKAFVTLTAAGATRRLGQGNKPLRSPLYRATVAAGPTAYWPLEDDVQSTQAAAATSGTGVLVASGPVQFASSVLSIPGAAGQVDLRGDGTNAAQLAGPAPSSLFSATPWQLEITGGYASTGSTSNFAVRIFTDASADPINFVITAPTLRDGNVHHVAFQLSQSGSNINIDIYYDGVFNHSTTVSSTTLGRPVSVALNPQGALGDDVPILTSVVLFASLSDPATRAEAITGYVRETADTRLNRLCGEEGFFIAVTGTSATEMGAQSVDTFLNLLRECESADLGRLFDGLSQGFTYVCRTSLYNEAAQVTINANSGQVPAVGPVPALDDQRITNRATVTRTNGSSVIFEDVDGALGSAAIGVFDGRFLVNVASDRQLKDIAAWQVHLGTVDAMRYPQVLLDLAAAPELANSWINAIPSDRIDLTNLSSQLTQHPQGDVSLLVEGWTETINSRQWRAAINCSNFRPQEVFTIADSRLGRLPSGNSTLHQNYSAGATSLLVDVNSGPLWATGSVSYDLEIRGWQIHVTNISGSSSPQTFTVTAIPADLGGGNPVNLWKPGVIPL